MKQKRFLGWYVLLFSFLFLFDRVTKFLMIQSEQIKIKIAPFLSFELSFNRGISWGLFSSAQTSIFVLVSLMTVAVIIPLFIYAFLRWRSGFSVWGETVALAGALSNLVDRVFYGGVVDFISVSYGWFSWPVFNVADICIVVGIFFVLLGFYKEG